MRIMAGITVWILAVLGFTAHLAQGQSLQVTNNLRLWLRADALSLSDGQSVNSWTDSSTNANHATQSNATRQPTFVANGINGRPVVRFDSGDDFFETSYTTLPGGLTYFAVFRTTSADATSAYDGNAALNIIGDSQNSVFNGFGITGGRAQFNAYDSGWRHINGGSGLNTGRAHDISVTFRPSDGLIRLFVEGSLQTTTNQTYFTSFMAFDRIGGGFAFGNTGDLFDGDLAEVLIYGTALSDPDLQSIENYFAAKYAVPEPSAGALLLVLAAPLILRSRRVI